MTQENASQSIFITSTSKVLGFLEIFNGAQITLRQIDEVSNGHIDYFTGHVVTQNYSQGNNDLDQIGIDIDSEGKFVLTNNSNVALNSTIFDVLGNTYLINRPREIWISNLNDFRDIFRESSQYKQRIACAYYRISGEIILLSILSAKEDEFLNPILANYENDPGYSSSRGGR